MPDSNDTGAATTVCGRSRRLTPVPGRPRPRRTPSSPAAPASTTCASRSTASIDSVRSDRAGGRLKHRVDRHVQRLLAVALGGLGHLPDHRQHRALDRLPHRPVGGLGWRPQRACQDVGVDRAALRQHVGEAGHDLGEDDAAVAAGAGQRRAWRLPPRRPATAALSVSRPSASSARGAGQVGAGVAVGHGVDVQVVQAAAAGLERGRAAAGRGQGDLARACSRSGGHRVRLTPWM